MGSNPRLYAKSHKIHSFPYPTIEVKVLMPLRGGTGQPAAREEKKITPLYKTALSPKQLGKEARVAQLPRPVFQPPPVPQKTGMFLPENYPQENPPGNVVKPPRGGVRPAPVTHPVVAQPPKFVQPPSFRPPTIRPQVNPFPVPAEEEKAVPPPIARPAFVPPPVSNVPSPAVPGFVKPVSPPKKGILEQANFGIKPAKTEDVFSHV